MGVVNFVLGLYSWFLIDYAFICEIYLCILYWDLNFQQLWCKLKDRDVG